MLINISNVLDELNKTFTLERLLILRPPTIKKTPPARDGNQCFKITLWGV